MEANIGTGSGATILDIKGSYTGATIGKTENVNVGGHKVPVTAVAKVAAPSLGKAIARFAAGVVPVVATGIAVASLLRDINVIMRTPSGGGDNQFFELKDRFEREYQVAGNGIEGPKRGSAQAACTAYVAAGKPGPYADQDYSWNQPEPKTVFTGYVLDAGPVQYCQVRTQYQTETTGGAPRYQISFRENPSGGEEVRISEPDLATRIARESGWPDPTNLGNILREAINSGQTVEVGTPTVTGPATSTGTPVTKTTTNAQGQSITTTTNTTNNYTYAGNTVTNSPTTVTTTVNNNTGEKTEETETTDDKRDECQKNPDSLSCATTDVPDGTIPKKERRLTYSEDSRFSAGGGTCPPDAYARLFGQDMKVWDWTSTCNLIVTYVRPVVLVLAVWIAVAMLVPGKGD